jgi:DNA-binding transcriptional regulator YiaG
MKNNTTTARVRQRLGTTQEGLAHLLGVSFPTINSWERGRSVPRKENAELLAILERVLEAHSAESVRAVLEGNQGSRGRLFAALVRLTTN